MKDYLNANFGTTKISEVDKDLLKEKLEGPSLIERTTYRKQVGIHYKKEAIAKGQILRRENKSADTLEDHQKNHQFGFACLHYSVSEAAGHIRIKVLNKLSKSACSIGVRTVDGDAVADNDYVAIDKIIQFKSG